MEELLTIKDIMRILKISRAVAYHYVSIGAIPSVRLGRGIRIESAAITEFIKKQKEARHSGSNQ